MALSRDAIFLMTICMYIKVVAMVTLRNTQTIITVHTYDKTWNEAETICNQTINGTLFVEDSQEKSIVLETYKGASIWNTKVHVWIGLHYPSVLNSGTSFGWTDCSLQEGGYSNYLPSEPKDSLNMKCVLSDKTGGEWITQSCDNLDNFVCETVTGTDCTYDAMSGSPPTNIVTMDTAGVDVNDCQTQCLNTIHNFTNCWAVTYDVSNSLCTLYFLHDPFYIGAQLTTSGETTYIKNCYSNAQVTTPPSSVTPSTSSEPTQVCTEYSSGITTTSTTTNPTTSTSTASPESTTTSTVSPGSTTTTTASPESSTTSAASPGTTSTTVSVSEPSTTSSTTASSSSSSSISSTAATTTISVSSSSTTETSPFSMCGCSCDLLLSLSSTFPKGENWANSTVEEKVQYYVERLKVDKTILSSTSRRRSSAEDERVSSKSVGYVAIVFLAIIMGLMVLSDLISFIAYIKSYIAKIKTSKVMDSEPETSQ